jgi:outer membrane protein insertion porin family
MPGRHTLLLAVMLAGSLLFAPALRAQSRNYAGLPIQEVRVQGNVTLTEEDLLYYLGLDLGSAYDPGALNQRLKELWDRDLIDAVDIDVSPLDNGVAVTVTIEERPTLVSIDYQGLDKLKRTDITEMIDKKRIELFEGSQLSKGELARLETEIESLYADKGYRFADAAVQLERVSDHELRVVVQIDEGDKVKIGKVSFDGNEVFGDGTLRSAMKKTKKSNLITRIRKRDVYNPATVEEDLDKVREVYHNAGYKNLVVGQPELTVLESGSKDDEGQPKKRELGIVIPVEEGERWKLGAILFEGNDVLPDELLKNAFEEPKGGWLRQDIIDKGLTTIEEFYSNTGYMFARVEQEIIEREDLVADVKLIIDEGDQFRVGRIEFSGNSKTKDRVLRRALRVQEGMVFNSGQLKNSLFRINQLEYFKVHEEDPVELDIDSDRKKVNLVLKGDEAERTELTFGGGYSEIDGFFLQGGIRTRNFLGRGETLGVQVQTGRYTENFDVSYFIPWLRDKPQNVGFQLFKRNLDYDLYASQRFVRNEEGGSVTYQRVIGPWSNISASYSATAFEDFRSFNFFGDEDTVVSQAFDFTRSALNLGWSRDKRDSSIEATRGMYARAGVEYAGGFLGGEDWYIRPTLGVTYFKKIPLGGLTTVAGINIEGGLIDPFGTNDDGTPREIFFLNRYFLGGEQSIRGFEYRSIWARDFETGLTILEDGFPKGGDKFFQLNLEYQFLLGGPFRLVPFLDAANVFDDEQSYDLSHLRYSAGLELRINVPLFGAPLRFIWANNIDPLVGLPEFDEERFQSFDFSIGTSF